MKQTSSALTFLLAQYRAIFKRAYVKGIASAVLLTAGLAAGAAQATANDLSSGWNSGDALVTETADDTFEVSTESTVGGITINAGHKLTTSGSILSTKDMTASGDLTIESGAILLADKETVGSNANQTIYRHNFTSNGGTTNLSGNIGAASFSLSNGTLVLTSGGEGNTNLTAYGSGWNQDYNGTTVKNASDYDRSTANGELINMDVTIVSGTNVAALNRLTVDDSKITLSGSGSNDSVSSGDTAYLEGSREIVITDTEITAKGYANGIFSQLGSISDSTITVEKTAKLLITGNADNYTNVLSGSATGSNATYTLTGTSLTNSGIVHLDTAVLNLNDGTVLTNSGTMILGRAGADNVVNLNDGAAIKIDGKADGHIYAQSDINMTGGEISLVTTDGKFGLIGVSKPADYNAGTLGTFDTDLTATGGKITVTKSQIQMNNITLGGDVEVTLGTHIADKDSYWTDNALINAEDNNDGKSGVLTINGASITMNAGSSIMGREVNLNAGEITLNGSDDAYESSESGSAMVMAYSANAVMNLAGGSIAVDGANEHGAIRSKALNLTGTALSVAQSGTLTIAGLLDKTVSGANAVASDGGIIFNMTGGSINNAGTLNLGVVSGDGVNNSGSVFTFAGGTFTNTGTIHVGSGSTFETAQNFTLDGSTGTLNLNSGSSATFGGENVTLNGDLVLAQGVTANVVGKVTYNGDGLGTSGNKVDITGSGDVSIAGTGTLIIDDAANTIGLTYTAGADGALGTFSGDSTFAGIASGSTGILYLDVTGTGLSGSISNENLATFATNLKQVLTGNSGSALTIKLDGVTFDYGDAIDETTNSADFTDVENALATGVSDGQLDNTSISVSSSSAVVQGSIGQVALGDTAGNSVTVGTKTPLVLNGHEVNGQTQGTALVTAGTGATATVGGATLQAGSNLNLAAANGTISDITATAPTGYDNAGTVAIAAGSSITVVDSRTTAASVSSGVDATITRGDIGTASTKINNVEVAGSLEAKDVYVTNLNLNSADAQLKAESVTADKASITGSLTADEVTSSTTFDTVAGSTLDVTELNGAKVSLAGSTTAKTITATDTLTFGGDAQTLHTVETVEAQGALVVDQGTTVNAGSIEADQGLSVVGNAALTADSIVLTQAGGDLQVGSDANNGTGGTLSALFLNLNGNDLVVDPAFGQAASVVAVAKISDNSADNEQDAQVNGSIYALRNSIIALGTDDEQLVKDTFTPYLDANGSLSNEADKIGALVYIHSAQNIADSEKIVADKNVTDSSLDKTGYTSTINLAANSALAINVDAAKNGPALNFAAQSATISATDTSKIVLAGDYASTDTLHLFQDAGNDGITLATGTNSVRIETLNGLMYKNWTTTDGNLSNINVATDLQLDTEKVQTAYTDASDPVRHSIIAYVAGDANWDAVGTPNYRRAQTHGALVAGASHNGTDFVDADGNALANQDRYILIDNPAYVSATETPDEPVSLVYVKAENAFLTAVREQVETSGAAAESAARMGDFAGVAQVALKAGAATTDAIAGRMGMGAQNSAITFANNGQGAGIWVTPIYMSSDSDGFDAQGVDYGTDINLYGVALGGDYTLANGVRVGAMFNVGSGDADGQGAGSAVTSDFDYYGFGLYVGYSVGQFSVVGDISYTAVDNDVEASTNIAKLETSLDSSNLSLGVTGSYAFETAAGIKVTPHVGLRYSNIDIDDYSVKADQGYGTVGDYSADSLSVFSIPVGVTIASEFQAGTWSVKPSFDLTLTGNFGDDEAEGTFHWAGVENIDSSLTSEIFDNFTYGASLGVAAQSSSGISLGVAVGYTGSSNTDDFGVSANARFTF